MEQNINAKAERPKASIWLVRHYLRSLNTDNKEHYMKNMSKKNNLDVLNSLYWDAWSTQEPWGCRLLNMLGQKAAEAVYFKYK